MNKNEVLTAIEKWSKVSPETIAKECSPRHIQSVLEDAKETIASFAKLTAGVELPPLPEPEALGMDFDKGWDGVRAYGYTDEQVREAQRQAIAADRARLAGQEAAQWQKRHAQETEGVWENTNEADAKWWHANSEGWEIRALYAAPVPAQAEKVEPVESDLAARCREILSWQRTGLLVGDALRNYAKTKSYAGEHNDLQCAESDTAREAYAFVANHGTPPTAPQSLLDAAEKTCEWSYNDDPDYYYDTQCGNTWSFVDGSLKDNHVKFCPFCAGRIYEAALQEHGGKVP